MRFSSPTDSITHRIIASVIAVHQSLGPGFVEALYQRALLLEVSAQGLSFERELTIPVSHRGQLIGGHRLDLLVERKVILEVKAVEKLSWTHLAQLRSYMHAADVECGLLVNFGGERAEFRRLDLRRG